MTHLIERFAEYLKSGKYNSSTVTAYRNAIFVFYNHHWNIPQSKINDDVVAKYLKELGEKKDQTEVIQAGKAIKLFYEVIFNKTLNITASGESKKEKLPEILTKEEVRQILDAAKNIKHKVMLMLTYGCGLRISDVLVVKVQDVNMEKKTLTVHHDEEPRILRLPPNTLDYLVRYFRKEKPKEYLFPSTGGSPYSARNVQLFFQSALKKTGIKKDATVHTLRHSFAVHCLEAGMDIHILQQILGHKFVNTTTTYNQLADVQLKNLRSPLEDIDLSFGEINFPFSA